MSYPLAIAISIKDHAVSPVPCSRRRTPIPAASSAAAISFASLSECAKDAPCGSSSNRRHPGASPLSTSVRTCAASFKPASTPMPRARNRVANSIEPVSRMFTEQKAGRTFHAAHVRRRWSGSVWLRRGDGRDADWDGRHGITNGGEHPVDVLGFNALLACLVPDMDVNGHCSAGRRFPCRGGDFGSGERDSWMLLSRTCAVEARLDAKWRAGLTAAGLTGCRYAP
jgi:hypothetical protein